MHPPPAFATAMAILASGVFLARLLPQPIRTLRTGAVAGVSGLAGLNAMVADGAWLVYGVRAGLPAVWLVSIPALVASGWTVFLVRHTLRGRDAAAAAAWLAAVVIGALTGTLQLALAAAVLVTCGPQLWSAFSHRSPTGLSAATWWLAVADATTWGGYGLLIGDRALELYGAVLIATAASILVRLRLTAAGMPSTTGEAALQSAR